MSACEDGTTRLEGMHTMRATIDLIRDETMRADVSRIYDAAMPAGPRGTMRAWMQAHDGDDVHTLQGGPRPWFPGIRTVDASRAGSVRMGGSSRDYKGCRVVCATDDVLVVETTFGDDIVPIMYWTV